MGLFCSCCGSDDLFNLAQSSITEGRTQQTGQQWQGIWKIGVCKVNIVAGMNRLSVTTGESSLVLLPSASIEIYAVYFAQYTISSIFAQHSKCSVFWAKVQLARLTIDLASCGMLITCHCIFCISVFLHLIFFTNVHQYISNISLWCWLVLQLQDNV